MNSDEFIKLKKKYNRPRDPEQQEKYWEYERKIREIMKKPPNDKKTHLIIGINELKGGDFTGEGYYYDPEEQLWCVYETWPVERTNDTSVVVHAKKTTEEEAFQYIYRSLEENVKRYEWELEREKNDRMTREEFLEWYGQENRVARLAEKGPYQILLDQQPGTEQYAVGYYKTLYKSHIERETHYEWAAYVIINGECEMEIAYKHETRAIYMVHFWIQRILDGKLG